MKKKAVFILLTILTAAAIFAQVSFERDAVLNEKMMQGFIANHVKIFDALRKSEKGGSWLNITDSSSPRTSLDSIEKARPPQKISEIFQNFGLDAEKGHLQLAIMQYGIVAWTIEDTLKELAAAKRSEKNITEDKKVAAYLNELKSQINSADYSLVSKYSRELYSIFNTDD